MTPTEELLFLCYDEASRDFIVHKLSDLGGLRGTLYQHGVFFPRHRIISAVWVNQIALQTLVCHHQRRFRDVSFVSRFRAELNRSGGGYQSSAIVYSRHDGHTVQYPYIEYVPVSSSGTESFSLVPYDRKAQPDAPYVAGVIGHSAFVYAVSDLYFGEPDIYSAGFRHYEHSRNDNRYVF
jgi:hypothetical protein